MYPLTILRISDTVARQLRSVGILLLSDFRDSVLPAKPGPLSSARFDEIGRAALSVAADLSAGKLPRTDLVEAESVEW